ncbi:unnamed protein product [Strongylus vulgaris]|uniref:Uncharacterized protein n=1 Tax=Strongylus vulgaris TaxID=40348 RepID=A0A3P7J9R1_STRVU|nr:unnamed protein product [Strongylus vulgaris]
MFCYAALLAIFAMASAEHWTVYDADRKLYCIILDADPISMTVKFAGPTGIVETYSATINGTHGVSGKCQDTYGNRTAQSLKVSFFPAGNDTPAVAAQPWELEFIFGSDEKKAAFELIDYSLTTAPVPEINSSFIYKFTKADGQLDFQGHEKNAFKCSNSELPLSNSSLIDLKNVNVVAFAQLEQPQFPKEQGRFYSRSEALFVQNVVRYDSKSNFLQ